MTNRPPPHFQKSLPTEKKISLAEAERAIYIDFEGFEKEQCMRWYQIDISNQYVNAKIVARALSKNIESGTKPKKLKQYEQLTRFHRKRDTGEMLNTKCLREALKDLERYGELRNKGRRTGWTKLREHNRQDVEAMKHIVMATLNT